MSFRPKKTDFKGKSDNYKTNKIKSFGTLDQIVCINVKPKSEENGYSVKLDKNNKSHKPYGDNLKFNILFRGVFEKRAHYNTQKEAFDAATKYLILVAQIIGIFPIGQKKICNARWPLFSWRYANCIFMSIFQLAATILCYLNLISTTTTINKLAYFFFYLTTLISSIFFLRLTTKWNNLMKELEIANLNEYIDQNIERKCNFAVIALLGLAFVDHGLSLSLKWTYIVECVSNGTDVFKPFLFINLYFISEQDVPFSTVVGIYFTVQNFIVTIIASYVHLFIICISLYLSSILKQINKVILSKDGEYLPTSYWRKLREDYNNASRLVRRFDDVINCITLISFASNLLFVCLQLSYLLANGIRGTCQSRYYYDNLLVSNNSSGSIYPYIYATFSVYSVMFLILRSLGLALIAARIHSESLVVVPVLYNVPSPTCGIEVQRFIQQIHGSTVALTGHNFFYVTKDLLLSVVGTIVTYELVLLQFE